MRKARLDEVRKAMMEALGPAFKGAPVTDRMLDAGAEKVMPRRIAATSTHYAPKVWWVPAVVTSMTKRTLDPEHALCAGEAVVALRERMAPTYFVTPTLLETLAQTEIDSTMHMDELPWPHEAMLFMLPRAPAVVPHRTGMGDATMAAWSVSRYTNANGVPGILFTFVDSLRGFGFINMPREPITLAESLDKLNIIGTQSFPVSDPKVAEEERGAQSRSASLVVRLMLAMTTPYAEIVTPERMVREASTRQGKERSALWHPIMLGDRVTVHHADGGGTHDSPRTHWRRGHFRRQACGEGLKERRTIWLRPMLVNAKEATNAGAA